MPAYEDKIDLARDHLTGDVEIPLREVNGIEAVTQGILIRLQNVRGEFFADTDLGPPWVARRREDAAPFGSGDSSVSEDEAILGQKFDEEKAIIALSPTILDTPGVNSITLFEVTFNGNTRGLTVRFSVDTIFGESEVVTEDLTVAS